MFSTPVPDDICLKCMKPVEVGLHLCPGSQDREVSSQVKVPEFKDFSGMSDHKKPWARAVYVGQLLGIPKTLAYDLWPKLDAKLQTDLLRLPPVADVIQTALDKHFEIEQEKARVKLVQEQESRRLQEKWDRERRECKPRGRTPQDKDAPAETPLARIKIMLWAINKCGTATAAKLAWDKAIKMAEEVEAEQEGKTGA